MMCMYRGRMKKVLTTTIDCVRKRQDESGMVRKDKRMGRIRKREKG